MRRYGLGSANLRSSTIRRGQGPAVGPGALRWYLQLLIPVLE